MIVCRNISKTYTHGGRKKVVLKDVSFTIGRGERVALLGCNGAGKTTLIKIIGGVEMPTSGKIERHMSVSWPLGFSGGFQGSLTGLDNAKFIARIYGQDYDEVRSFVEDFTELGGHLKLPVRTYSSGMRARLAFALSLAIEFDCYLIDEIILVGDQNFQRKCHKELFENRKDRSIVLALHNNDFIKEYCSSGIVLHNTGLHLYRDINKAIEYYDDISLKVSV
jgi:capsular polysaccharide transport system ATP-binding protein